MMTSSNGNFDIFFDLRLNIQLSKQSRRRWFKAPALNTKFRKCVFEQKEYENINYESIIFKYQEKARIALKYARD